MRLDGLLKLQYPVEGSPLVVALNRVTSHSITYSILNEKVLILFRARHHIILPTAMIHGLPLWLRW